VDILSPKTDIIFKLIFGDPKNKNILTDFLESVLDLSADEYEDITIVDPHLTREYPDDKLGILDVKLTTKSGKVIDIEVQVLSVPEMRSRITYYLSNMITEQLASGDSYYNLKRAICIVIVDFPLIEETDKYHSVFEMLEKDEHFPFNDLMEINILDLTRIPKDKDSRLLGWMRFMKASRKEEFEMAAVNNAVIGEAYAKLKVLSDSEANRMLYESRLKAQRDEISRIEGALAEGRVEGRAEGEVIGVAKGEEMGFSKVICSMLDKGLDAATIASYTNIPVAVIEEIAEKR